ncbi:hypothetical protein P22_3744 [Propionispora sp. 2/2-37]|uniref:CopG family transcriptional regulator n=1 Tax=Propionispora sp. 2/2-37 TaxID=1677858 RepID=UPI0006C3E8DA|nr:CopG family transcriptional regulator [Propionispora sp. 2/2-37]CUH97612.1 hypothetical protein P22_3744 [Propionispora sp. 2/2-37]
MSKERKIVKYSARIPSNVDKKIKIYAQKIGVSKNAILLLALKDYMNKEVHKL